MRLAVLFIEYNNGRYVRSFERLRSFLKKIKDCSITYYIIDNLHEGDYIKRVSDNTFRIGGDNSNWEFSGWQRCLDVLEKENTDYDVMLFANDAFMAYGWNFIEKNANIELLRRAVRHKAVIGHIDTKEIPMNALGFDVSNWLCTNCFIIPGSITKCIDSFVSVDERIANEIISQDYWEELILEKRIIPNDLQNGYYFELEADFGVGTAFRLEVDQSFFPESELDPRELCIMIKDIVVGGQSFDSVAILSGFYEKEGPIRWMRKTARVEFPEEIKGPLRISGHLPTELLVRQYGGALTLKICRTAPLFLPNVPVGASYRQMVLKWLTEEWHSRMEINAENWRLYRNKVKAMLNESLLTARIREKGFRVESYRRKSGVGDFLVHKLAALRRAFSE